MTRIPPFVSMTHGFQSFSETGHWDFQLPLCPQFELGSSLGLVISPRHPNMKDFDLVQILIILMVCFYHYQQALCVAQLKKIET